MDQASTTSSPRLVIHPARPQPRRRGWWPTLLAVLLLLPVGYLGGVTATNLFPVTLQTATITAEVRLLPWPAQASTVHVPTAVGDIDMVFEGPLTAPGITVAAQVQASVTQALAQPGTDVLDLVPTSGEIQDAARTGLVRLALTYLAGATLVVVAVLVLYRFGRATLTAHRSRVAGVLATSLGALLPALGAWQVYQPGNLAQFRTSSLLGEVRANTDLFTDIPAQAQAATPYVQNLLALSEGLQSEFAPAEAQGPVAARFLLVSDLHSLNYYPFMREIVQAQDITAVIDTGDLVNFGTVREGELAGLFSGIGSLEVPYLFVRGNHDATSETDTALLRRLEQVPNVTLLQPSAQEYAQVDVHGVVIAGFNDYRWFGDDNPQTVDGQAEIAADFMRAWGERPSPDILASHEPYAVDRADTGQVRLNGHLHRADLEGNRVRVGSFTGGGLFDQVFPAADAVSGASDPDRVPAPYAFDILAVDESCAVSSLTRYSYQGLVTGTPTFDDISLVSGSSFALPPEDGRSCSAELGITTTPVPAVDPDSAQDPEPEQEQTPLEPTETERELPRPDTGGATGTP